MDGSLLIGLAGSHLCHCICMSVTMDIRVQRTGLETHINRGERGFRRKCMCSRPIQQCKRWASEQSHMAPEVQQYTGMTI